ncbi:MAG: 50S ribosomal protein L31e [Thermoproteota archaeon]|jgi:large subunit ribosomal protein L31e|nr:50S ribosomal protein L31e [Thermoproteota archaeon]
MSEQEVQVTEVKEEKEEDETLKKAKEEVLFEDEEIKEERVLILNLRDAKKAPLQKRSKKAINLVRELVKKYTKKEEIWIDNELNEKIWERGIKKPPNKIKLRIFLTSKDRAIVFLSK